MQASFLTRESKAFAGSIDPRVKLALCVFGSLTTIAIKSPYSLALMLAASTAMALTAARPQTLAKVIIFTTIMMLISLGCSWLIALAIPGLFQWNALSLSVPFLRMLVIVTLLLLLALSTPSQIISRMLQSMKMPGFLHIPLSVVIRFIPTFMDDCKQIGEAARLRPGKNFMSSWRSLVVPLIFRTLASADDLAVAAELKGMSALRRPTLPSLGNLRRHDYIILFGAFGILCAAIAVQVWVPIGHPGPMS